MNSDDPGELPASSKAALSAAGAARLFAALDKGRNTEGIGPLWRDELCDRELARDGEIHVA
jgi:hypothetical protein